MVAASRRSMIARLSLLGAVWLVTSGSYYKCTAGSDGDPRPMNSGNGASFTTVLILRDSNGAEKSNFMFGEPIRFELSITNLTDHPTTLQFNDGHTNDYLVVDGANHHLRWLWSQGMAFTQATTSITIDSLATRTYTITWNGVLADGTQLMPGTYQARGALVFDAFANDPLAAGELGSPLKTFTVN